MGVKMRNNFSHAGICSGGLAFWGYLAVTQKYREKQALWVRNLPVLTRRGLGVVYILGLFALYQSRQNKHAKLPTSQLVMGCAFAGASAYLVVYQFFGSLLMERISTFALHFGTLYLALGAVISLGDSPPFSILASEIMPNTHLHMKLAYLCLNMTIYSSHSYTTHFLNKKWKLDIADYGYVNAMGMFYMSSIAFGMLADKYGITKKLAIGMSLTSTAIYSVFALPDSVVGFGKVSSSIVNSLYIATLSPIFPLLDVMVMSTLEREYPNISVADRKGIFSRIRMWSSLGHAVIGMLISYICNVLGVSATAAGENHKGQFTVLIASLALFAFVFSSITYFKLEEPSYYRKARAQGASGPGVILASEKAPAESAEPMETARHHRTVFGNSRSVTKGVGFWALFGNGEFMFFLFTVALVGVTRGTSSCFLVSYISTYFGENFMKITSIMCVRTLSEVAILYFSKSLLKSLGYYWLLFLSLFCATMREFNYARLPRSEYVIYYAMANEILKGISSSCLTFSAVNIADMLAGERNKNLAQSFFSTSYNGFSILVSAILSIVVAHTLKDFRSLFLVASTIGFAGMAILIIKYGIIDMKMPVRLRGQNK